MEREFSAGGLVFRREGGKVLWLIRRPMPNPEYRGSLGWSFPKGWIDDTDGGLKPGPMASGQERASEEELAEAAIREVREEGGVEARVVTKLPTIKVWFRDQAGERVMKFITYFVMEYVSEVPGGWGEETEEARWVSGDEARKVLAFKNERELLGRAEAIAA